jgi:hypothetical protein
MKKLGASAGRHFGESNRLRGKQPYAALQILSHFDKEGESWYGEEIVRNPRERRWRFSTNETGFAARVVVIAVVAAAGKHRNTLSCKEESRERDLGT